MQKQLQCSPAGFLFSQWISWPRLYEWRTDDSNRLIRSFSCWLLMHRASSKGNVSLLCWGYPALPSVPLSLCRSLSSQSTVTNCASGSSGCSSWHPQGRCSQMAPWTSLWNSRHAPWMISEREFRMSLQGGFECSRNETAPVYEEGFFLVLHFASHGIDKTQ